MYYRSDYYSLRRGNEDLSGTCSFDDDLQV